MSFVSERGIAMRSLLEGLTSVSLFLQLSLSGCAVGPSYQKPATTLEKLHNAAALETRSAGAPAPALETWWDGFDDPMLSRIVQRARAPNLDFWAGLPLAPQA